MTFKIIVACDESGGIGQSNKLPWNYPEDLSYFRRTTIGNGNNCVIMGKHTYESIPCSKLPKRFNIIVSTALPQDSKIEGLQIVKSLEDGLELSTKYDEKWIIGGSSIYEQILARHANKINEIHITRIKGTYSCDKFFRCPENWIVNRTINLSPQLNVEILTQ